MKTRLDTLAPPHADKARVLLLAEQIEAGALAGAAARSDAERS